MKAKSHPDYFLLELYSILIITGIIFVYSATGASNFFIKHMAFTFAGILAGYIVYSLKPSILFKLHTYIYIFAVLLLLLTLFFGTESYGARRWLKLGFKFEPSQFFRIAFVLFIAGYIDKNYSKLKKNKWAYRIFLVFTFFPLILILLQKDLGLPFTLALTFFFMLYIAGFSVKNIFFISVISGVLTIAAILIEPYRFKRITAFMNEAVYQVEQSKIAFGSGGIFGKGIGNSTIKLDYQKFYHTDFMYALIGEELGAVGSMAVAFVYMVIFLRMLKIAQKLNNFMRLVMSGFTFVLFIETSIHILVCFGLLPPKGLCLPFISYGGSSLVSNYIVLGIVMKLTRYIL